MNEESLGSATKPCPMCGEPILATAKKCKHCGEYLDSSLRPQQSTSQSGLDTLAVQSQMKSIGVVALLAIFIPLLGAAYGSVKASVVSIIIAIAIFCIVGFGTGAPNSAIPGILSLAVGIAYIISVFWAISAASSYNSELIAAQTSKRQHP